MATWWTIGLTLVVAGCSASEQSGATDRAPTDAVPPSQSACQAFDYDRCLTFLPPQRMQGVWLSGFERSSFLAGTKGVPDGANRYDNRIWFTFASGAHPDPALRAEMDRIGGTVAVAIEFDGRRSRDAGQYGHNGVADHVVVVDRIVSTQILGRLAP